MFYVTIKNVKTNKWEYARQEGREAPRFDGNFEDAVEFHKVDDAINWFGRQRARLQANADPKVHDLESICVQKVSRSIRQELRW